MTVHRAPDALPLDRSQLRRLRRAMAALHRWYHQNARDLPWRRARDPYAVWVSEVMLQQTKVSTVIPYFERWMRELPDLHHLAQADEQQLLKLWEGLGYYSRARNLQRAARELCAHHGCEVPDDPQRFARLPGVGPYTCAAVMSIAFQRDMAVLDGNVKRVLCRLGALPLDVRQPAAVRSLQALAQALLPAGTAAVHNQAMMELGATCCTPRSPRCDDCPLQQSCAAHHGGDPTAFPASRARAQVPLRRFAVGLLVHDGHVLLRRRPPIGFLGGLWEFPRLELDQAPGERALGQVVRQAALPLLSAADDGCPLPPVRHAYSHFRVQLFPWLLQGSRRPRAPRAAEDLPQSARWVELSQLDALPLSTADRRLLARLRAALEPS